MDHRKYPILISSAEFSILCIWLSSKKICTYDPKEIASMLFKNSSDS